MRAKLLLDLDLEGLEDGAEEEAVLVAAARELSVDRGSLRMLQLGASWAVEPVAGAHVAFPTSVPGVKEQTSEVSALRAKCDKLGDAVNLFETRCRELQAQLEKQPQSGPGSLTAAPTQEGKAGRPTSAGGTLRRLQYVEGRNKELEAECGDFRARLLKADQFQQDVLGTIHDLKRQLAQLTEELALSQTWDPEIPRP
eukprot:Hpha_TRINITY_DN24329_c0_g1::TRINITY_DN24329_c0_g1_i1::g.147885::m.147885